MTIILAGVAKGIYSTITNNYPCPLCSRTPPLTTQDGRLVVPKKWGCKVKQVIDWNHVDDYVDGKKVRTYQFTTSICGRNWVGKSYKAVNGWWEKIGKPQRALQLRDHALSIYLGNIRPQAPPKPQPLLKAGKQQRTWYLRKKWVK